MDEIIDQLKKNQTSIFINRVPQKYKDWFGMISKSEFNGNNGATARFLISLYMKYRNKLDWQKTKVLEGGSNGQV